MTTTDLHQLLTKHTWRAEFMACDDGQLRIFLQDMDAPERVGVLAVEPSVLVLPDEAVLNYSYQDVSAELEPPPEECLILDLKTRTEPDFPKGSVPFLFD